MAWGAAEATLFFIVPDVWLSWHGRKQLRQGLIACAYALAGALLGGALTYQWGSLAQNQPLSIMVQLPAVDGAMIERVAAALSEQGPTSVLWGPLTGTPYKLFAAQAAEAAISLPVFMAISIPARLIRFVLVTMVVHRLYGWVTRRCSQATADKVLLAGWASFYLVYFVL